MERRGQYSHKCVDTDSQDCGLVPGAQWGSPPPVSLQEFTRTRLTPDGEGLCREGVAGGGGVWSQPEAWEDHLRPSQKEG